ncbi:MAG: hypothetical protein AAF802_21875 [Planctomycetota bacterium]
MPVHEVVRLSRQVENRLLSLYLPLRTLVGGGSKRALEAVLKCTLKNFLSTHDSAETVIGGVYQDQNRNGIPDRRDTDAEGRYTLPIEGEATIFVRKPRGWN